jgi:hypothetical protein
MAYEQTPAETAAIGLIDQHTLDRSVSPELMLVDPELAERARELLREPHEANGKGEHMSAALGTHEIIAGTSLGLEPPLSQPLIQGPLAPAMPTGDGLVGLPTPPPAIRPPESAIPVPVAQADVPRQQPEPAAAPAPPAPPRPDELPLAPPPAAPVYDYFASESTGPGPETAPVERVEAAPEPEIQSVPLMAPPPPPAEEQLVELPTMAPPEEPAPDLIPAAAVAPKPVEPAPLAPIEPARQPEAENVELTDAEPRPAPEPVELLPPVVQVEAVTAPAAHVEELFARQRSDFRVVVRLKEGEGVLVGTFRDFGTAMAGAQEVIEQFSTATESQWPFYAGRFIRPDLIVSVDVVEGDGTET